MKYLKLTLLFILCTLLISADDFHKYGRFNSFTDTKKFASFGSIIVPDTSGTFSIAAVVDSARISITISGFDPDVTQFEGYYQTGSYPARGSGTCIDTFYAADTSSFASGRSFPVNDSTGVTIYVAFYYFANRWADDSNRETVTGTDLVSPTAGTLIASGANYDSLRTRMTLTTEAGSKTMVRYAFGSYPADTSAGTLFLNWRAYATFDTTKGLNLLTQDTILYVRAFHKDSMVNQSNASDTAFIHYDDIPPTLATVIIDTLGTDSVEVTLSGFSTDVDTTSMTIYTAYQASPVRNGGSPDKNDTDSLNTWRFAHGVTDQDTLYLYTWVADSNANWSTVIRDTLVIPDMWVPLAGTLDLNIFVPDYDDSTYVTNSASTDVAYFTLYAGTRDAASKTIFDANVLTVGVPQDTLLDLSGLVSYVGNDTLFLSGIWTDDYDNESSTGYDSIFPTATQYIVNFTIDTSHAVIDSLIFGIGSVSDPEQMNWDMRIGINDTLAGSYGDTLKVDIPDTLVTQFEIAYVRSLIRFTSGLSEDTSDAVQYPGIFTGGTITFYGRTKN